MQMSPGELLDRFTVSRLYVEKLGTGQAKHARFTDGFGNMRLLYPDIPWDSLVDTMYGVNAAIWESEAPIHNGLLEDPIIAGALALRVRKWNKIRTGLIDVVDKLTKGE